MQITVEQSATLTSATSGSKLRAVVQQKLRAFEDEIQFVVVSVFKSTSTTSNASFEVTCRIGTRSGFATGTFHGKGKSAVFALEEALRDVSECLKHQPK
jgi:hypothetical protein